MGKYLYLFIVLLLFCCGTEGLRYEQAIEDCRKNPVENIFVDPASGDTTIALMVSPECIVGAKLPNFQAVTIEGKSIDSDELFGKVNIINFWFQTCPPCVAEIPGLNKIKEKYGTGQVNYLAIGTDSKSDIEYFIEKTPFQFDLIAGGHAIYREVFSSPWGFPLTIVTNKKNVITNAIQGGRSDSLAVEEIMKQIEPYLEVELDS